MMVGPALELQRLHSCVGSAGAVVEELFGALSRCSHMKHTPPPVRRALSTGAILAIVFGSIFAVAIPAAAIGYRLFIYGNFCNDSNIAAVTTAWRQIADEDVTIAQSAPEPHCDEDDPAPVASEHITVPTTTTPSAVLVNYRLSLGRLGWIEQSAFPIGAAPKNSDGDQAPNVCSVLRQHGRVLTTKLSVATVASQAYTLEIVADRQSRC